MKTSAREEQDKKDRKRAAIFGTLFFHAALLFLFLTVSWTEPDPLPEPKEVLIEFDFTGGSGSEGGSASSASNTTETSASTPENLSTEAESEVTVPPKTNPTVVKTNPKPPTQPQPNPNALFGGNNNGSSQNGSSIGNNNGNGTGGTGNSTGTTNGNGTGLATGNGASMTGRTQVASPKPANPNHETGKLYFHIWVNQAGVVTRCTFDASKSTGNDSQLIEACKDQLIGKQIVNADPSAATEQRGVYVFSFSVQ